MHGVDSRYAWWRLSAAMMLSAFGAVGMWGVVVVFPALQSEFGASRADVSFSYTTTMLGFGAGAIVFGRMIDTRGAFASMVLATLLLSAGYAAAAIAPDLWLFAAAQGLLIGFGSAAAFIPLVADTSHWFMKSRGLAMGICASGNYIGGAAWPLLTDILISTYDWRTAYLVIAVVCLVGMLPLCLMLRAGSPAHGAGTAGAAPHSARSL